MSQNAEGGEPSQFSGAMAPRGPGQTELLFTTLSAFLLLGCGTVMKVGDSWLGY